MSSRLSVRRRFSKAMLAVAVALTLIIAFSGVADATEAELTTTWGTQGSSWSSTTPNGITVTATATAPPGGVFASAGTDLLRPAFDPATDPAYPFSADYVPDHQSWSFTMFWGNTISDQGRITFNFSQPVTNPVLHIDRMGGWSGDSNSSVWTLNTAFDSNGSPASLSKMSGVDHLEVTPTTIKRTVNQSASRGTDCGVSGSAGTACGSVQVNGVFTSIEFLWHGEGGGIGDGVEVVWELFGSPELTFAKTTDHGDLVDGDIVTYTLTATNPSNASAEDLEVVDSLPAGMVYVPNSTRAEYTATDADETTLFTDGFGVVAASVPPSPWGEDDDFLPGDGVNTQTDQGDVRLHLANGRSGAWRPLGDLTAFDEANVVFEFRRANISINDQLAIYAKADTSATPLNNPNCDDGTWLEIGAISYLQANDTVYSTATIPIPTAMLTADVGFCFFTRAGNSPATEFFVDNVSVIGRNLVTSTVTLDNDPTNGIPDLVDGTADPGMLTTALDGIDLNAADSLVVTFQARFDVSQLPPGTTEIVNTAGVESINVPEPPPPGSVTNQVSIADLSLTKSDNGPVDIDDLVTYDLVVTNDGPRAAVDTIVTDTLDPNLVLVSATPSSGTCTDSGAPTVVTCDFGTIPPNQTETVTIIASFGPLTPFAGSVGVDSNEPGIGDCVGADICNTASVSTRSIDPDPSNNGDDEPTDVLAPDLAIEKTAGSVTDNNDGTYDIGYTVTITNSGDGTGSFDLNDTITNAGSVTNQIVAGPAYGAGTDGQQGTITAGFNGATQPEITADEPIAGGATDVYTYTARFTVPPGEAIADSCASGTGSPATRNSASLAAGVAASTCTDLPSVTLDKVASTPTNNGDGTYDLTYTVTVSNVGTATGSYHLSDTITTGPGVTLNGITTGPSYGGASTDGQQGGIPAGFDGGGQPEITSNETIDPGRSDVFVYTARFAVNAAGGFDSCSLPGGTPAIANSATLGSGNESETCSDVPLISLTKVAGGVTDNGDGITPGVADTVDYTLVATTAGSTPLTNVTVNDSLIPAAELSCSVVDRAPTGDSGTVTGNTVDVLAPGDDLTCSANYILTQTDIDSGTVVNTANVSGDDPDGNPVGDISDDPTDPTDVDPDGDGEPDDPTVVPLAQFPSIEFEKTAAAPADTNGDGFAGGVGDDIAYSFTVTNTGNVTLSDLSVSDVLVAVAGGPIPTLAPGVTDTTTFTATYTITQADVDAGVVANRATVTAADPGGGTVTDQSDDPTDPTNGDPDGDGEPDDPTVVALVQRPAVEIEKSAGALVDSNGDGIVGGLGDVIPFSFRVTNTGNVTLANITASDALVAVVGGPIPTLAPGASDTATFTATYTIVQADVDAGTVTNRAIVLAADPGGNPVIDQSDDPTDPTDVDPDGDGEPDDPTVVSVTQVPSIEIEKTAAAVVDTNDDGIVGGAGDVIGYSFTVTNTGNVTLTDVVVTDALAAVSGGPIPILAPGDSDATTFAATYTITQADADAGSVTNSAMVTGSTPAGNPVTDVSDDPADPSDVDPDGDGEPDDPTVVDLTQTPLLELEKTAGSLSDSNGDGIVGGVDDEIAYSFSVTNSGSVTLTNITVTDTLVAVSGDPIPTLAPGESDNATFTATYTITQSDVEAGSVTNSATATGSDPGGNPVSDESDDPADPTNVDPDDDGEPDDPTVVAVTQRPNIEIEKSANALTDTNGDGEVGGAGDLVSYAFTVINTGNVTVTDITVSDVLVSVAGGPIALAPGSSDATSFTATYAITQADIDAGEVTNRAVVVGSDPAGNPVTDQSDDPADPTDADPDGDGDPDDPTVVGFTQDPEIQIEKTAESLTDSNDDGVVGGVGDDISYSFMVTNAGNVTLFDVTIADPLVAVTGGPIPTLAPGESDATTFSATSTITQADLDAGTVVNRATATAGDPGGNPVADRSDDPTDPTNVDPDGDGDPDDPTVVTFIQAPALTLAKVGAPQTYAVAGELITYTYTVQNSGNVTVSGPFVVADDTISTGDIDCSSAPANLAPGESFVCNADYAVTPADIGVGTITNIAGVEATDPTGTPVISNEASETVTADLRADMAIQKLVLDGSSTHVPGSEISYELTVTNNGPSTTTIATVTDTIPADTTFISAVASVGSCSETGGTITCDLGVMLADDIATITVTLDIDPTSTGLLTNVAEVVSDLPDPNSVNDSSTVSTSPTLEADVAIDKVAPTVYVPGLPVSYSLDVSSAGPSQATGVVVTDTLPPEVTYDAANSDPRCSESGGIITCDPVDLGPDEAEQFTIVVLTTADMTADLTNTAAAQSPVPDPDTTNNQDDEITEADPQADIGIDKTGPTEPVAAGAQFDYTIAVSNAGPSYAINVVATDLLPPQLTFVSASVAGGSGTETCDGGGTCQLGDIPAGATETITMSVQVDATSTGDVDNTATVTTTTDGDDPVDNTDGHTVTVVEQSDLAITKSDSVDPVRAGDLLTYTLTATNAGPSQATGVTVIDTLPVGVSFEDAPGCTFDGASTVTCDPGTVAVGPPLNFDITVRVDADVAEGATLDNFASVTAPSDTDPGNNDATESTLVTAEADLAITKASSPKPFVPGQEMTYTISVINIGPSDAQNVTVTDTLPVGFTTTGVAPTTDCAVATGELDCVFPTLAAGDSLVITVVGQTDPAAETLTNTATVDADTQDPDPDNNSSIDVNTGDAIADLSVVKSDSIDPVAAGAPLTYTITVTNNGPSNADNVMVDDVPPAGFTVESVDRTECDTSVSCLFPLLGAGESEQIVVTGTVASALADTGSPVFPELSNTVTVSTDTVEGDPDNNTYTETTDVVEQADLALTKIGQGSDVTPGQQATFSIEVVNAGPSDADGVMVTDTLPAGVSFVSATGGACTSGADPSIVTCDLGTIPAGNPPTVVILTVDVAPDVTGSVVNQAVVSATTPDPAPENNADDSEDPTAPDADLSIEKIDLADPVLAGTELTYQLTVRNGGPSAATEAVVTDTLPAETSFVSTALVAGNATCSHDGAPSGGTVTCDLGSIDPGGVVAIDVTVAVDPSTAGGATIANTATVTSATDDPQPLDNTDGEDTLVEAQADVGVTKVASADPATPGQSLSYTIRVRNNGPSDALGVSFSDTIPAGLTVTAVTITPTGSGSCTIAASLTCDLGTLAPNQEVAITIDADIDPTVNGSLVNTVTVTTSSDDPNPDNNVASSAVPVVPEADLTIDKTGPDTVVAGTRLTYNLVVSNLGPSDAQNVVISDTLPTGASLVGVTIGAGTGSCLGAVCTFPTVPAGTVVSAAIEVDVASTVVAGTTLLNRATVDASTADPEPTNNDDNHPTEVLTSADLSIVKSAAPDPFVPGRSLTYTLVVTNAGPSAAAGTKVSDPLPAGLTAISVTADTGSCTFDASSIDCDLGDVDDGQQVIITVVADTDPSVASPLANTAVVDSDTDDPNPDDNTGSDISEPLPSADLQVIKTGTPLGVLAGEIVSYTVEVTNLGSSTAVAVELSDTLPAELAYISHSSLSPDAACSHDASTRSVRCTQPSLLPNGTISIEIIARVNAWVPDGTSIENTAGVTSPTPDPVPENNTSTTSTEVSAEADLSVIKTLATDPLVPGTSAQYQLLVANAGPSDGQAVQVEDSVPAGLVITGAVASAGTCAHDDVTVICDLGAVAAGATAIVTVDVIVAGDVVDDVINTAVVTTTTTDPDPTNDTSTSVGTPSPSADLVAIKTTVSTEVVPGEIVDYLITIANGGPSDAAGVTVNDLLPAGLTALSAAPTQGTCVVAGESIDCVLGTIPAGQSVNVAVTASVPADLLGDLTNTAVADADTPDPDLTNNDDFVTDPVSPTADLALTKSVTPIPFVAGLPVTYTIVVTNNGPSDATGVNVTDVLPAGVTPISAAATSGTCAIDGATVTCSLGALPVGDTVSITVEADTDPGLDADITNGASTSSETADPDPGNNDDAASTGPSAEADLAIAKDAPAEANGGDTVTYSIVVTNAGPSTATDVVIVDALPSGVIFFSASPSCTFTDPVVTCSVGDVAPDAPVSVQISATVLEPDSSVTVTNTATVSSPIPDPDETNNTSTDDTVIAPAPLGTIEGIVWKDTDIDGTIDPGEPGIGGVSVIISGDPDGDGVATVITVVTDADGTYAVDLPPGDWAVEVDPTTYPPGLAPTTPTTFEVPVEADNVTNVETGFGPSVISGRVWLDENGDGTVDPDESDISGVEVRATCSGPDGILGSADDLVFSDITASPYSMHGVPVGQTCRIEVVDSTLPSGVGQTYDPDGVLDNTTVIDINGLTNPPLNFGYRNPTPPIAFTGASTILLVVVALGLLVTGSALVSLTTSEIRRSRGVVS